MDKKMLGIRVQLPVDFETALKRVADALQTEGFGVLTEIDVQATLHKKLGVDFRPYRILGACNPPLAYRALSADAEVGLLLPCNVTVSYHADRLTDVALLDPLMMTDLVDAPELAAVAQEARERLLRVAAALRQGE